MGSTGLMVSSETPPPLPTRPNIHSFFVMYRHSCRALLRESLEGLKSSRCVRTLFSVLLTKNANTEYQILQ